MNFFEKALGVVCVALLLFVLYIIVAALFGLPGVVVTDENDCQFGGTGKTSPQPLTGTLRFDDGEVYLRCNHGDEI